MKGTMTERWLQYLEDYLVQDLDDLMDQFIEYELDDVEGEYDYLRDRLEGVWFKVVLDGK
jgi:hypothetical protein